MMGTKVGRLLIILCFSVLLSGCLAAAAVAIATAPSANPADAKAAEINAKLGAHYLQQGEYQAAKSKLDKALDQDPNSALVHNVTAALYLQLEVDDKAELHFKRAVELAPDYSEAQNNYGVFLCGKGRYREAEELFLKALENPLYPQAAEAYENAGLCVQRIPDIEKAVDYFNQALHLDSYMAKSLLQLGNINYDKQDYEQAQAYLRRYREVARHGPQSLYLGIKVASKLSDRDAIASYRLLLRSRYPDSKEAELVRQGQYK